MRAFSRVYEDLDASNSSKQKVKLLREFFESEDALESAWLIYFFLGEKLPRLTSTKTLREWLAEQSGTPLWLIEESYASVGDLAETISLLVRRELELSADTPSLDDFIRGSYLPLLELEEAERKSQLLKYWSSFDRSSCFLLNKMMTGGLRVGVSKSLIVKALAEFTSQDEARIAHRLSGKWCSEKFPQASDFERVITDDESALDPGQPYPFFLAYPLEDELESLGAAEDWQAEWKWDGIRGQLIRRRGQSLIWSRGDEAISDQFPEVIEASALLPFDAVIDGELLAWDSELERPASFADLQRRLGRKRVGKKLLSEVPVVMLAYDLLEHEGEDLRTLPLRERRSKLEQVFSTIPGTAALRLAPLVDFANWEVLRGLHSESRARRVEGFMLKSSDSEYGSGRRKGSWWKWKVSPLSFDAVMTYAQQGHGRRAGLYSDYTFAVWSGEELVTVAKAYSGLTNDEIAEVDRFVRRNTLEKFGPVRAVNAEMVFEIECEGIARSKRHKSGLALRFPRIARIRSDKLARDANTLEDLEALLREFEA